MYHYHLLNEEGSFIERRCSEAPLIVGVGAEGELSRMVQVSPPLADILELKSEKNAEINRSRATANSSSFTHGGKTFSCDALSRSDIDGVNGFVALNDALPPSFPGAWKATDNTLLHLSDVSAWKAFYGALVATGSANFAHSQQLKTALAEATTAEEVAAIVW